MRRRGGAWLPTTGFLAVGLSSASLLAAGPRVLGGGAFSGLATAWTITTVFGLGMAMPVEQHLGQRLNAGSPTAWTARASAWSLATGVGLSCLVVLLLGGTPSAAEFPLLVPTALGGVVGWAVVAWTRGHLAGAGDLVAYGSVLFLEAIARGLLVLLGLLFPAEAEALLAAAVGLPMVLTVMAAVYFSSPPVVDGQGAPAGWRPWAFIIASVGYQLCLSGAPIIVDRLSTGSAALTGQFVAVNTYARAPAVLVGGIVLQTLVSLSYSWGRHDFDGFRAQLRQALGRTCIIVGAAGLIGMVASPVVVPLFYGSPTGIPWWFLLALMTSTWVAMCAGILSQALLATGGERWSAGMWLGAAATTAIAAFSSPRVGPVLALGLIGGPVVALVVSGVRVRRLRRGITRAPSLTV